MPISPLFYLYFSLSRGAHCFVSGLLRFLLHLPNEQAPALRGGLNFDFISDVPVLLSPRALFSQGFRIVFLLGLRTVALLVPALDP